MVASHIIKTLHLSLEKEGRKSILWSGTSTKASFDLRYKGTAGR